MTEESADAEPETLGQMSHTNPYTGEAFGSTQTYARGRVVAADGGDAAVANGSASAAPDVTGTDGAEPDADATERTLGDVDHTPPRNAPRASAAYLRGNETTTDE